VQTGELYGIENCGVIICFIKPTSSADYLEICRHFDIVFIQDIPQMSLSTKTEARRFINLIDTLYDSRVSI